MDCCLLSAPGFSLLHPCSVLKTFHVHTSSISSLPGQDAYNRTSNLPSLVVSGWESMKVKDCYLNLQHHSLHYWAVHVHCYSMVEEGNLHYKAHYHRVGEQYLHSPKLFISVSCVWIPGVKHLKCFAVLRFLKAHR